MTESTALAPPEPPAEPTPPPVDPPPRRDRLPWLTGAGFLILALAVLWVWRHPTLPPASSEATDALARQIGAQEARLTRLEQRPPPPPADLAPLAARVTALEQRPAPPPAASGAADLGPLEARVAALEQRPVPQPAAPVPAVNLAPLEARIAALEQRPPPNLAPLEARIAAVEQRPMPNLEPLDARIAALAKAESAADAELATRIGAAEGRLAAGEKRAARTAQVQAATLALAAGRKLGDLPDAPPALARFANAAPPTEAALRAAFVAAAREARAAGHPATDGKPLLTRLWSQAQELVTVRQGDHVLLGDPAAGVLEHARVALDDGDVATAVADVASLQGPAAQAMSAWLAQARALLDARAALATWAAAG